MSIKKRISILLSLFKREGLELFKNYHPAEEMTLRNMLNYLNKNSPYEYIHT
jgi:hypothetical protein